MMVVCDNCKRSRYVSLEEYSEMLQQGFVPCSRCSYVKYLKSREYIYKLRKSWFTMEEEVRYIIMNALLNREVILWDCRGEAGKCNEPLIIGRVPMVNIVGDIPIYLKGRYRIIEINFEKNRCAKIGVELFGSQRDSLKIDIPQIDLVLQGGGVIVIVAEPTPSSLKLPLIRGNTREKCRKKLQQTLKMQLAESRIPYNVWLIDGERLRRIDKQFLHQEKPKQRKFYGRFIEYKSLPWKELRRIVPEALYKVTFNEFMDGIIADKILELFE